MRNTVTMTALQHTELWDHLFPGDQLEAVALALCGRASANTRQRLLVHELVPIPHNVCVRTATHVTWPTSVLAPLLERATRAGLALLKLHSHPGGERAFSAVDDVADAELFLSIHAAVDDSLPHASAVMLPDGTVFGRAHLATGERAPLDMVNVIGHDLVFWPCKVAAGVVPEFALRHAQAFGEGTFRRLQMLTIAVVGCSGTGSIAVDLLARLGVGQLVLIDPDLVEEKNLNRILNAVRADIGRPKVEVLQKFVERLGLGTHVEAHVVELAHPRALRAVAACDVVIGCMDTIDGRDLLNRIATFYLQPYFDVGIRLDADGRGGVEQVCGSVHYVQPGSSSLLTRSLYTAEQLRAAGLRRTDPTAYAEQVQRGYIRGIQEDRPAVNAVNMTFASLLVADLLARLHSYRLDPNAEYAAQTVSLSIGSWQRPPDGPVDTALLPHVGRGDMRPPLNRPYLDNEGSR